MAETEKNTTETVENKAKTTKKKPEIEMVTIKLPLTRKEKDDVYVAVNGKSYLIKRGVPVEVPVFVKEVLDHREEMLDIAMEYEAQAAVNNEGK